MKIRNAVRCQIVGSRTYPCISHDGDAAAGFCIGKLGTVATARSCSSIEGMIAAKLVAHFVCDIINIVSIAGGCRRSCDATCFLVVVTYHPKSCKPAASGAEGMANIIIGSTYAAGNH